jgi:ribosome maturation factor RimP
MTRVDTRSRDGGPRRAIFFCFTRGGVGVGFLGLRKDQGVDRLSGGGAKQTWNTDLGHRLGHMIESGELQNELQHEDTTYDSFNEISVQQSYRPMDEDATPGSSSDSAQEPVATEGRELRWQDKLTHLASEIAQREGCELYDLEVVGGGGNRVVRITIDREPGVSIDDCANVSRGLNLILDVEDLIPGGAYQLEVSSPGIERALRTPRHYQRAIGQRVQVKCFETLGSLKALVALDQPTPAEAKVLQHWGTQKSFEAQLLGIEGSMVSFEIKMPEGKAKDASSRSLVVQVALDKIAKAHTVFVMEKSGRGETSGKSGQKTKAGHPKKNADGE